EFSAAYAAVASGSVELAVHRSEGDANTAPPVGNPAALPVARRAVTVPALGSVAALGVLPATVLVSTVASDSAAEQGGLRSGDLILAVDGAPVGSFGSFAEIVRTSQGRPLQISFARNGELHSAAIAPRLEEYDSGLGVKEPRYLIGITPEVASLPGALEIDR